MIGVLPDAHIGVEFSTPRMPIPRDAAALTTMSSWSHRGAPSPNGVSGCRGCTPAHGTMIRTLVTPSDCMRSSRALISASEVDKYSSESAMPMVDGASSICATCITLYDRCLVSGKTC